MADEDRIHSAVAVKLFFKRKNDESLVDVIAQQADASLAPRPELWRNVVDNRDAALFHLAGDAPIEGWRIDDDSEIGHTPAGFCNQMLVKSVDFWQMAQDFGDADDGQILCIDDRVTARGAHAVSADAEEFERCVAAVQGFNQLGSIHFARGFAG